LGTLISTLKFIFLTELFCHQYTICIYIQTCRSRTNQVVNAILDYSEKISQIGAKLQLYIGTVKRKA